MRRRTRRHTRALERLLEEPGRPLHSLPSIAHNALSVAEHLAPVLLDQRPEEGGNHAKNRQGMKEVYSKSLSN